MITFDPRCLELAELFFTEERDRFPKAKHEALLNLLASDIQQTIEDFMGYPDLTLKHLDRTEERERERAYNHVRR